LWEDGILVLITADRAELIEELGFEAPAVTVTTGATGEEILAF